MSTESFLLIGVISVIVIGLLSAVYRAGYRPHIGPGLGGAHVEWLWYAIGPIAILFAFLFFASAAPLWSVGYSEAGGPSVWILFVGLMILVGLSASPWSLPFKKPSIFLLGGLMATTMLWYLAWGLYDKPDCLAGDTVCEQRIAAVNAAKSEELRQRAEISRARAAEIELARMGPCNRKKVRYYFAPNPDLDRPANPNGQCRAVWEIPDSKCIYQEAAVIRIVGLGSAEKKGPFGGCRSSQGLRGPDNVEYMWASDNKGFWGYLTLEPG